MTTLGKEMKRLGTIKHKNILFLQGPMGSFFKNIDKSFRGKGANTYKIGFNLGDWFFSEKDNYIPYKGTQGEWGEFIYDFLSEHKIDKVFLFGDCRFYQRITLQVSNELNINVFVFEEGYLRPSFITMERQGVNDFSHLPREVSFYKNLDVIQFKEKKILDVNFNLYRKVLNVSVYYMLKDIFWFLYPHYTHHNHYNFISEAFFGVRNILRKNIYKVTEKKLLKNLTTEYHKQYYFVPLQTYNDFQILEHSNFYSIEAFIEVVMISFAKYAPKETKILLKHHPMDRGRKNYVQFIDALSKQLKIQDRTIIAHDLHIPSCLKSAIGTVTINSTVGMSSLYHQIPTKILGNAIYDIEELTCKNISLDAFWENYTKPNKEVFEKFRLYLIENTQLNGSFYGRLPDELM